MNFWVIMEHFQEKQKSHSKNCESSWNYYCSFLALSFHLVLFSKIMFKMRCSFLTGANSILREFCRFHLPHPLPRAYRTDKLFSDTPLSSVPVHLDTKCGGFNSRPSNRFHQRKGRKDAVSPLLPLVVLFWWVSVFSSVLSASCYKLEWHQIQPLEINVSYLTCLVLDIPWHLSLLLLTVYLYVGMCTCECWCPRSPEEGVRCPEAGMSGGYELPYFKEQ